jgi:tetratricopeptide (TPR) repeat protein
MKFCYIDISIRLNVNIKNKIMKKIFLTFCLSVTVLGVFGKGSFEITTNIKTAYANIIELRLEVATTILANEKKVNSDNLMVEYLENYIDCIKIFISEDAALFDKLEPQKYKRLDKIEAGDKSSEYYLHTQAMMRIHWLMARSKFGESLAAIRELKKASQLFNDNEKKFPNFIGNDHGLGCIHVMVGAIPDDLSWGKSLLGLSGDLNQGFRELANVLTYSKSNYYLFEDEAIMMTAYLQLQFGRDKNDAWTTMSSPRISITKSPIAAYLKALVGVYSGRTSAAISVLAASKSKGNQYAIPQWDYLYGTAKLYRLDKNADFYLNRFATTFKGRNQIKQAYEKLAQHALVFKGESSCKAYITKGKTKGHADSDGDKTAQETMNTGRIPDVDLLKADLLHSGGYYTKSLEILNATPNNRLSGEDKVQHLYLQGRNYQDKKSYTEAVNIYKDLLDMSESKGMYYACNAALQIGLIYEKKGLKTTAKQYFEKCLSLDSNKYEGSIHARAKIGLSRVE